MNMNLENISFDVETSIVDRIQAMGLDKIRCSLTGQIIAEINIKTLESAINYMRFEMPLVSETQILDQMQLRWLVQCSRPAPHLTSFKSHDAHTYLVQNHPRDIFAMLYSRMLFEHGKIENEMNPSDALKLKLFWLIELQDSEFFSKFSKKMKTALDALIRMDAMHSIRNVFYSDKIRKLAAKLREETPTEIMLIAFVEEVESHSLNALTKRSVPPEGNRQSLNAALAQAGLLPWQIRVKENEAKNKTSALAFAAKVVETMKLDEFERIKAGYSDKHTVVLDELSGQIPNLLHQKYLNAERAEKEAATAKKNPADKSKKVAKSSLKAAARFGNLDFNL